MCVCLFVCVCVCVCVCTMDVGRLEASVDVLLDRLQPCQATDRMRRHVVDSVYQVIEKVAPEARLFLVGSFPLKTYLPDGDIDLSIFMQEDAGNGSVWNTLRDAFKELEDGHGPLPVRETVLIDAEVRLV